MDDLMADLKVDYSADLPRKIEQIQADLESNNNEEVRNGFHKLKGTGKTYGLPEVSELCAVVEELCIKAQHESSIFVPLGLELLGEIHKAHCADGSLNLQENKSYLRIREFLL